MFRYRFARRLAIALAFPATTALPLSAVAHGLAHEQISVPSSHADDHSGEDREHRHDAPHAPRSGAATFAERAPGSDGRDHAHPDIDATVTSKGPVDLVGIVTARIESPLGDMLVTGLARGPFVHPRVRAHGTHAPPPSLRSPPATIT